MSATKSFGLTEHVSPSVSRSCSRAAGSRSRVLPASSKSPCRRICPTWLQTASSNVGVYKGIPRTLDLMDKHQVKFSSFMMGEAVDKAPDLAREIVARGHEAAAHGRSWENSYLLEPDAERRFITEAWKASTRRQARRRSAGTPILQSLGFKYHIDEPSADQPFIIKLKGGDFVTVPYTLHMNDIASYTFEGWNPAAYEQALKDEFDQLYEEGAHRRHMMVVGLHDRISGHANRVRVLDRFLTYASSKPGVWFGRKDEIAAWAIEHREATPVYDRGALTDTGLPGSAA